MLRIVKTRSPVLDNADSRRNDLGNHNKQYLIVAGCAVYTMLNVSVKRTLIQFEAIPKIIPYNQFDRDRG